MRASGSPVSRWAISTKPVLEFSNSAPTASRNEARAVKESAAKASREANVRAMVASTSARSCSGYVAPKAKPSAGFTA